MAAFRSLRLGGRVKERMLDGYSLVGFGSEHTRGLLRYYMAYIGCFLFLFEVKLFSSVLNP